MRPKCNLGACTGWTSAGRGWYHVARARTVVLNASLIDVSERGEHTIRGMATNFCSLSEAIEEMASVDRLSALELMDLGAVYLGEEIKGQAVVKWRRITDLLALTDNGAFTWPPRRSPGSVRKRSKEALDGAASTVGVSSSDNCSSAALSAPKVDNGIAAVMLSPGALVRVHPSPKRFLACTTTDWRAAVVYQDKRYVVVNKPAGLPCMRHESNAFEEVASCAARALGLPGLEACHRLDTWTTGLLVCSCDKEAIREFKALLEMKGDEFRAEEVALERATIMAGADTAAYFSTTASHSPGIPVGKTHEGGGGPLGSPRGLSKIYQVLTDRPIAPGRLTSFMFDGPFRPPDAYGQGMSGCPDPLFEACGFRLPARGPRLLSRHNHPGWKRVVSEVMECEPISADLIDVWMKRGHEGKAFCRLGETASSEEGGATPWNPLGDNPSPLRSYWCSRVRLITGRTHQIRAQFAAEGCPLLGDVMYSGVSGLLVPLSGRIEDPDVGKRILSLPQVDGPIGLHASELMWDARVLKVAAPWEAILSY